YVCTARAPKCAECGISTWCRKFADDRKRTADMER
ncbi:MAG: endonuclease III, partial [Alistipes sp.]|nr:endonuclease III [Alistipes sp.]